MSSVYLSSENIDMIEHLLAEIRQVGTERNLSTDAELTHLLAHGFEQGLKTELELRSLVTEYVRLHSLFDEPHRRAILGADAPSHRQEHMLPSPDEEFDAAKRIYPIDAATRGANLVIGRNFSGEAAMIFWQSPDALTEGQWMRSGTNEPFAAISWVATTWTADEIRQHSTSPHID